MNLGDNKQNLTLKFVNRFINNGNRNIKKIDLNEFMKNGSIKLFK
jgi:hypothetical protein